MEHFGSVNFFSCRNYIELALYGCYFSLLGAKEAEDNGICELVNDLAIGKLNNMILKYQIDLQPTNARNRFNA